MRQARNARGLGLVLVGLLMGALLITPATAHFTQNTKHLGKHAWRQFIKQKVYTRARSDARFLPGGDLPAGTTIRGVYSISGPATDAGDTFLGSISYGWRLASAPTELYIRAGSPPEPRCPGTVASPQALPGTLCVYERESSSVERGIGAGITRRSGATLYVVADDEGHTFAEGSWAVTSP
jgi:hypothetical protein